MKTKLTDDINKYISRLNQEGLWVTVHGRGISGLLQHNIHSNPFCTLVKTDPDAWKKCIQCQQKVLAHSKEEQLFGMCHAGVEEYVFFVNDKTFISVSGYGIHQKAAKERIERLSRDFLLNQDDLLNIYEAGLKHEESSFEELSVIIHPLCHMISLLQLYLADVPEKQSRSSVFDAILAYVQFRFMDPISIKEIAYACSCSESTVCHLFKQYTGQSVKQYIAQLRIEQAKKLLQASDIPVSMVAQMCGFSNLNYFPTAFKKRVGVSPTEYRARSDQQA